MESNGDMPWYVVVLIPLGFFVVFPLFWSLIVFLISRTGWSLFAREFATVKSPESSWYGMRSGRVGIGNYNGVLNIAISADGIFLEPLLIFRPGHKRLLIPFSAIEKFNETSFLFAGIRVYAKSGRASMSFTLPPEAKAELEKMIQSHA